MMRKIVPNRRAISAPRTAGSTTLRRISRAVAALVLAAGAMATVGATSAQAADSQGCRSGYVCIYPQNAGWNGGRPSLTYYNYGVYNLSNQVGTHRVFNNQVGGATVYLCRGYNGVDCNAYLRVGNHADVNLTPINSIILRRSSGGPNQPV